MEAEALDAGLFLQFVSKRLRTTILNWSLNVVRTPSV